MRRRQATRRQGEKTRLGVREPAQQRARGTMDRIVAATQRLLRTHRFEDITIAEIVSEADTSTGSFYARFGSKDALLPYLYARYNADTAAATADLGKGGGLNAPSLREAVATLIDLVREGPVRMDQLVRTMTLYARSHSDRLPPSAFVRSNQFFDIVGGLFKPHLKAPHADRRARFAAFAAATLLREYRFFPDAPLAKTLALSQDDFAAEVERMIAAYVEAAQ